MKRILILLMFFLGIQTFSQTDSGDLESYLNTIISNMPGDSGDNYKTPTSGELTTWTNCINALLSGDLVTARTQADMVNYQIVDYTNTGQAGNKEYYILEEKSTQTNYWGTFVFAKTPDRDQLVIQAPHAIFDFNTGKQAVYSFVRLNNKALFLNGTHRCNHSIASTCSGTTSVCGVSGAFKISDMAHNADSMWQKTTELMDDSNTIFVQLHGFTKLASDPYVILSNGTDQTPTNDYANSIKDALFTQDNTLTFKVAHLDSWTRLVGFTNTQGRLLNNSTDPCSSSATSTTGNFVHLEQEKSKLRQDATGWEKLHQALSSVFNTTLSTREYASLRIDSEVPFTKEINFSADNVVKVSIYDILGKQFYSTFNKENRSRFSIDTKNYPSGLYILKVETDKGTVAKKLIRE